MSPRAYEYLREKFAKHLPHAQTIRQWYRNSDIDSSSGIGSHALDVLANKAKSMQDNGQQLVISLVFDEMAIQRNMAWCRSSNKFIGLIDCGTPDENDEFTLANNVIVFMACGLNSYFQQPIAFYFVRTLKANERADLLTRVMNEISKRGIRIGNITFDGYKSNATMCAILGADFKSDNGDYTTFITNPYNGEKVYIIYDPSHNIKLVRNTLGTQKILYEEGTEIKWKYFEDLVGYSAEDAFGLTHKMNKRHLQFEDRKMHVRTAVQTLSQSTADSMQFLQQKGLEQFVGSEATAKFIRLFNTLWDVMNSQRIRSDSSNKFKSAINPENLADVLQFLYEAKSYILSLKILSKRTGRLLPIVSSDHRTGFRGFIITIISVIAMYKEYVENHSWMTFFATYRLSQDHLEMLFGNF